MAAQHPYGRNQYDKVTGKNKVTAKFSMEVGRLVARSVEQSIKRSSFEWDLQTTIEKDIGFLDGILMVTVTGEAGRVESYIKMLEQTFKGME